jgi:hypothetical protein
MSLLRPTSGYWESWSFLVFWTIVWMIWKWNTRAISPAMNTETMSPKGMGSPAEPRIRPPSLPKMLKAQAPGSSETTIVTVALHRKAKSCWLPGCSSRAKSTDEPASDHWPRVW